MKRSPILISICCILNFLQADAQINWHHTDGPEGLYTNTLEANDKYLFAPLDDFLYRTSDGVNWEKIQTDVRRVLHAHNDTLYTITYDDSGDYLLKVSKDNGETWRERPIDRDIFYGSFDFFPTSHGIYTEAGFKSIDRGQSWEQLAGFDSYNLDRLTEIGNRIYLNKNSSSSDSLLWRYDNQNDKFIYIDPPSLYNSREYFENLTGKDSVLIGTVDDSIYYSADLGNSWKSRASPDHASGRAFAWIGLTLYNLGVQLTKSDDFGHTWDTIPWEIERPLENPYDVVGFKDLLLISNYEYQINISDDGGQHFTQSVKGIGKGLVRDIAFCDDDIWVTSVNGLFSYNNANGQWENHLTNKDDGSLFVSDNGAGKMAYFNHYHSGFNTTYDFTYFLLSQNCGDAWDTVFVTYPDFPRIEGIELIGDNIVLFGNAETVIASANDGITWQKTNLNSESGGQFHDVEVVKFRDQHYYSKFGTLYSTMDGIAWTPQPTDFYIEDLFATKDKLFIRQESGLYNDEPLLLWSENLVDWIPCAEGLPENNSNSDNFFSYSLVENNGRYFTNWGLAEAYISTDTLKTWQSIESRQPFSPNYNVRYYAVAEDLYMAGSGLYTTKFNDVTSGQQRIPPVSTGLLTITPNPSDGNFIINTGKQLINASALSIYSNTGQLISSETIRPDNHLIQYKNLNLSEGIYHVIIESENNRYYGKVTIHK